VAIAERGKFLHAPDTYMEKIACGPAGKGVISLDRSPTENLKALARAKGAQVQDLTVVILDRPRHREIIDEVRRAGARIKLITDGDVSAAIATCDERTGVDLLIGTGGAPEGVLAAAALRCVGGDIFGRLKFRNDQERDRARAMGVTDLDRIYTIDDMATGDVLFAATGVTNGDYLKGVRFRPDGADTHSVVMRSKSGTVRYIEAAHKFDQKPNYDSSGVITSKR
jgi:fructose-1,6-bisphosphatase II